MVSALKLARAVVSGVKKAKRPHNMLLLTLPIGRCRKDS